MPQGWKQAPMQRIYERRTMHGYGIFPVPVEVTPTVEYTDAATVTINLETSGTEYRTVETIDSATVAVDLQVTSTEEYERSDAATVLVDIQVVEAVAASVPAVRTGTSAEISANLSGGSAEVNIPYDATGVVAFWSHWDEDGNTGMDNLTFKDETFTIVTQINEGAIAGEWGVGVAYLDTLPGIGAQTFGWQWDGTTRIAGGGIHLVFIKNAGGVRDAAVDAGIAAANVSVTLDTETTDLVLAFGESYAVDPALDGTVFVNNEAFAGAVVDLSEITPSAGSTTVNMTGETYSTMAAISLTAGTTETIDFSIADASDDGSGYWRDDHPWTWPPAETWTDDSAGTIYVARGKTGTVSGYAYANNGFWRWDTSSIPDDATITSATFCPHIQDVQGNFGFDMEFAGDYYDFGGEPTVSADGNATISSFIFTPFDLNDFDFTFSVHGSRFYSIPLTDLSGINKSGYTGIRCGLIGDEPGASNNAVQIDAEEGAGEPAVLVVTYTMATVPDIFIGVDQDTVLVNLDTSGVEDYTAGGVETVDSETVLVDIQSSGTELREVTDADTVLVDLQTSGTEYKTVETTDSATVTVDLQVIVVTVFPTTPVLDDFNRADETPLSQSGAWDGPVRAGTRTQLRLVSNTAARHTSGSTSEGYRVGTSFTESEAYFTVSALPNTTDFALVFARIQSVESTNADCYAMEVVRVGANNYSITAYRVDDAAFTSLAVVATGVDLAVGDKIGMDVTGTGATVTLRCFMDDGSGWAQVGSDVSDSSGSRITSPGPIGLSIGGTTGGLWRLDNFGGGEKVAPTEIFIGVDAAEVLIDISTSGTELQEAVDTGEVLVNLDTSAIEEYVPVGGIETTDSATVPLDLQTSGIEYITHETLDSATAAVDLQVATTEEYTRLDAAEVLVDLQPSGTELREITDASTVAIDIQSSGIEYITHETLDSATVPFDIQTTAVELLEAVDTAEAYVDIQPSGTDEKSGAFEDIATITVDITGTSVEIAQLVDQAEVYVDIQASGVEYRTVETTDSATVPFDIQVTTVEVFEATDTATVPVDIQTSGTDEQTIEGFSDAATIPLDIQTSATDIAQVVEAATVPFDVSVLSTELFQAVDQATVVFDLQVESYEELGVGDQAQIYVDIQTFVTEVYETFEAATAYVDLQPATVEIFEAVDANTVRIRLSISSVEFVFVPELVGVFYVVSWAPRWRTETKSRWNVLGCALRWFFWPSVRRG